MMATIIKIESIFLVKFTEILSINSFLFLLIFIGVIPFFIY